MKKPLKAFEIALSAIACAAAAGFLMLGSVSPFLLATGYLVAAFAMMVPLSKDFWWGSALCFLAAGLLALPLSLWKVVPYFVFFGLHPIVNRLQMRFVKKKPLIVLCEIVKAVWFDLAMWLSWIVLTRMAGMEFPGYIETYFFYILFLGGTLFFFVYDALIFACQKSVDVIVYRIRK